MLGSCWIGDDPNVKLKRGIDANGSGSFTDIANVSHDESKMIVMQAGVKAW